MCAVHMGLRNLGLDVSHKMRFEDSGFRVDQGGGGAGFGLRMLDFGTYILSTIQTTFLLAASPPLHPMLVLHGDAMRERICNFRVQGCRRNI